eukprot:14544684-Alexandrium_andersonii.AAC.1
MSASLVGSEMCIRDSLRCAQRARHSEYLCTADASARTDVSGLCTGDCRQAPALALPASRACEGARAYS